MPKVVQRVEKKSEFTLEFETLSSGVYDQGYIYSGATKIAQLTLIRCEESKKLIQLLRSSGIKVEVQ